MKGPIQILHLGADPALAALIQSALAADGLGVLARRVHTRTEFIAALQQGGLDVILANPTLPALEGWSILALAQGHCPLVPLIFVSGVVPAEDAIELVKAGAADYVFTDRLRRLAPAIRRALREAGRAQAETARRESQDQFQGLADAVPVMMWLSGIERGCTYFNQRWLAFTGRTLAQELGDGWLDGVHPDDRRRCLDDEQAAFADRREIHLEYRLRRADGQYRWVLDRGQPRFLADGGFAGYVGTCFDIHERREIEAALSASQARFARTFALSPLALTITRLTDGRLVEVNAAFEQLSGYTRAEALERTPDELNLWVDPRQRAEGLARLRTGEVIANFEASFRRKDGALRTCLLGAGLVELDDEPCAVTALIDITQRKQAEDARRLLEARFQTLAHAAPNMIWTAAPDGAITFANAGWLEYAGISLDEAARGWPELVLHPDDYDRCLAQWHQALRDGTEYEIEVRNRRHDGEYRWFLTRAVPARDPEGHITEWFGTTTDIHDRKLAEVQAETSRQRLAFLADISRTLSATLDYDSLMQRIAYLLVPYVADYASVYILQDSQQITNVANAHVSLEKQGVLQALHARVQLFLDTPQSLIAQVMRTGQPLFDPAFDWQKQYEGAPQAMRDYLAALRPVSHIILPLTARGHALGVMVLALSESDRRFTQADLVLAEEVAGRAALAADNARLFQQAQQLNTALEQRVQARTAELLASNTALAHERDLLQALMNNIPDTIYFKDTESRFTRINTAQVRVLGVASADDAVGKTDADFQPRELAAAFLAEEQQIVQAGEPVVDRVEFNPTPDGQARWFSATKVPLRGPAGQIIGLVGISRDITARVQMEEALRKSHEQLQALTARLQSIREEERARFAYALHDQLGQELSSLKMDVAWLQRHLSQSDPVRLAGKAQNMGMLLDSCILTVRRMTTELRPSLLDDFGLAAAVEWQLREFEAQSGIEGALVYDGEEVPLDREVSTVVFRIFQEILSNVRQHAQASKVEVELSQEARHIMLQVRDNGRGINTAELGSPHSLGLLGMRERVRRLAGELEVRGASGEGTTVRVRVPISQTPPDALT